MFDALRNYRWMIFGALALYCLWAGLLILQGPGLQYDEALLVLGAVHMRHSPGELSLAHDPNTWFCPFGRCFPLMTVRYVGAIKDYLCLPLFAAFGPSAEIVRLVSTLLGALGIWGIARLIREQASPQAAALTALLIAMNPAYVDLTVFDNGTAALWMGAFGVLCLGLARYLRRKDVPAAFWLGVAMGLGIWARANFLWLILAMFGAVFVALWGRVRLPLSHWAGAGLGAVVGGAPFLLYQAISHGGTWEGVGMFSLHQSLGRLLPARVVMFSEIFLSDREHRAMWSGPAMPAWQHWLFPLAVLAACALCLIARSPVARIAALSFLFLTGFLFLSKVPVVEHHLVALAPLAAAVVVLGASTIVTRYRWGLAAVALLGILYLGSAVYWQVAAVRGLGRTGGVGQWSDGVTPLADYLQGRYPGREIQILDWGLQNNLYVLSDGQIRSREIYDEQIAYWIEAMRSGGVFLMNGATNRQIPAVSSRFLQALELAHPIVRRLTVNQASGVPYAEIFEISPGIRTRP